MQVFHGAIAVPSAFMLLLNIVLQCALDNLLHYGVLGNHAPKHDYPSREELSFGVQVPPKDEIAMVIALEACLHCGAMACATTVVYLAMCASLAGAASAP